MTNEEAIKFANCLKNNYTIDFNDMADFCDTVTNALKPENVKCQMCGESNMKRGNIYYGFEVYKNFWCPNCGALAVFAHAPNMKGIEYKITYNKNKEE